MPRFRQFPVDSEFVTAPLPCGLMYHSRFCESDFFSEIPREKTLALAASALRDLLQIHMSKAVARYPLGLTRHSVILP